jgi:branched-chain amino acid transport system substrate-binding protein
MMQTSRRAFLSTAIAAASLPVAPARSQGQKLRIGVLTDLSGPYRDATGPTSVACARQAVVDFGASGKNLEVEVLRADHQNKADIGASIARSWIDNEGVDVIGDVLFAVRC